MLGLFGKKKVDVDKLSNILLNFMVKFADQAYPDMEEIIKKSQEFACIPEIDSEEGKNHFLIICIVGNMSTASLFLSASVHEKLKDKTTQKAANLFDIEKDELSQVLKDYKQFMKRVNHPSKNTIYAMSKGIFHKLNLNQFQEEYFKEQNAPNPMFQKRIDEVMTQSIFNWETFLNKHKISE